MSDSRYIKTTKTRVPKFKRTIPIHGAGDDSDLYFRCWNCGATCKSDREQVGTGSGVSTTGFVDIPFGTHDLESVQLILDSLHCDRSMLLEYGADGETPVIYPTFNRSNVTNGCWFCGCMNYK